MSFLNEYLDLAITVKANDSTTAIGLTEIGRLQKLLAVMNAAKAHPRRLGTEATAEELAEDKTRAKRVAYVAEKCLAAWGGEPANFRDANKIAATLNWDDWWEEHERRLRARQRYIATWAHRYGNQDGDLRWCKSAIVKLNNELKWMLYALR